MTGESPISQVASRLRCKTSYSTASFVEVEADRSEAFREAGVILPEDLLDRLLALCRDTSVDELDESRKAVIARGEQLVKLSERTQFDASPGLAIAQRLSEALIDADEFDASSRSLLRAAVDYFLLVDDKQNDLTLRDGFSDDHQVVGAVLQTIGRNGT